MTDYQQNERGTRVSDEREQAEQLTAEQEWCRQAGLSKLDWQRLVFTRWRYRQEQLTEYPEQQQ